MHELLHDFDHAIATAIQRLPDWVNPIMTAATFIGQPIVVLAVGALIAATAFTKNLHRIVWAIVFGYVGFGVNTLVKHLVHRTRPDTMFAHYMKIKSYSFPSGHSFGSMFFYGLLAYLAYSRLAHPWNVIAVILAIALILLVGVSRVYLGAHFPSDVLVGWLFGAICLVLVIKFVQP